MDSDGFANDAERYRVWWPVLIVVSRFIGSHSKVPHRIFQRLCRVSHGRKEFQAVGSTPDKIERRVEQRVGSVMQGSRVGYSLKGFQVDLLSLRRGFSR
jgi:hypothetical protein